LYTPDNLHPLYHLPESGKALPVGIPVSSEIQRGLIADTGLKIIFIGFFSEKYTILLISGQYQ